MKLEGLSGLWKCNKLFALFVTQNCNSIHVTCTVGGLQRLYFYKTLYTSKLERIGI